MEPLDEKNVSLSESEQKIIDEVRATQEAAEAQRNEKIDNALNAISVAALFDLFALSKSASFYVLRKMHDYPSFNAFLGAAFDTDLASFIPELSNPKNNEEA